MRNLFPVFMACFFVLGCAKGSKPQGIKGTPMLDVTCYGSEVFIEINGEQVYQGSNTSYSGVLVKGVKPGKNAMRITYEPAENSSLQSLEVLVRRLAPDNKTQTELLRWQAQEPSGGVTLEFELPSWEK